MGFQGEFVELPELPELESFVLEEVLERRASLRLGARIAERNVSHSTGEGEAFFDGLPDTQELSELLGLSAEETAAHLAIEAHAGTIAALRLELHHYEIPRKKIGYCSTESGARSVVFERCQTRFQAEFRRRFHDSAPLARMERTVLGRITAYEGATLGRLLRLLHGLRELASLIEAEPRFDEIAYHDALRLRALRYLKARSGWSDDEPGDAETPAPEPTPAGPVRRAEDDPRFEKFVEQHGDREGAIEWERSFRVLGPFLTARILLRRENPGPLEEWARNAGADCRNYFLKIREDVELTRGRLAEQGRPPELLQQLDRISALLLERLGAG